MNDTLRYLAEEPINRRYHHHEATFSLVYAFSEHFVLPLSHDEVVHGKGSIMRKMPGDDWQQRAGVRALLGYQWSHPGKQLLFMGTEFSQGTEWAESRSLDWYLLDHQEHRGVQSTVRDLNACTGATPRSGHWITVRRASSGSTPTTRTTTSSPTSGATTRATWSQW